MLEANDGGDSECEYDEFETELEEAYASSYDSTQSGYDFRRRRVRPLNPMGQQFQRQYHVALSGRKRKESAIHESKPNFLNFSRENPSYSCSPKVSLLDGITRNRSISQHPTGSDRDRIVVPPPPPPPCPNYKSNYMSLMKRRQQEVEEDDADTALDEEVESKFPSSSSISPLHSQFEPSSGFNVVKSSGFGKPPDTMVSNLSRSLPPSVTPSPTPAENSGSLCSMSCYPSSPPTPTPTPPSPYLSSASASLSVSSSPYPVPRHAPATLSSSSAYLVPGSSLTRSTRSVASRSGSVPSSSPYLIPRSSASASVYSPSFFSMEESPPHPYHCYGR